MSHILNVRGHMSFSCVLVITMFSQNLRFGWIETSTCYKTFSFLSLNFYCINSCNFIPCFFLCLLYFEDGVQGEFKSTWTSYLKIYIV